MLSLSMGPITAGYQTSNDGLVSAVPHAGTPVTPKARRKGKGRAANLGPSSGMQKTLWSTTASPINVFVAETTVTPGSAAGSVASACATASPYVTPRPPTWPTGSALQVAGSAANPCSLLMRKSPLYAPESADRSRPSCVQVTMGKDASNGVAEAALSSAAVKPLAARTASVAGFDVRSSPELKAVSEPRFFA